MWSYIRRIAAAGAIAISATSATGWERGEWPVFEEGTRQAEALRKLQDEKRAQVSDILATPSSWIASWDWWASVVPRTGNSRSLNNQITDLKKLQWDPNKIEKKFWETIPNPELWLSLIWLTTIGSIALGRRHIANKKTNEKDQIDEIRRSLNPWILRVAEDFIKILSRKEFNGEYEVLTIDQDKHIGYRLKGWFWKENYLIITNNWIQYVSMFDEDDISIRLKNNTPKQTLEELIRDTLPKILLSDDIGSDTFMPDIDFEVFIGFKEYKILLTRFLGDSHYTWALKKWCQDRDNLNRLRSIFEKWDSDDATASNADYQEIKRKIREIDERILKEKELVNRSISDIERIFEKLTPEQKGAVLSWLWLTEESSHWSEMWMTPRTIYDNILAVHGTTPSSTIEELGGYLIRNIQRDQEGKRLADWISNVPLLKWLKDCINESNWETRTLFIDLFKQLKSANGWYVYADLNDEEKGIIDQIIALWAVQEKWEEKEVAPKPSAPKATSSKQWEWDITQPMELGISLEDLEQRFDPEPIIIILDWLEGLKGTTYLPIDEWIKVTGIIEDIKRTLSNLEFLVIRMYEFSQKKYVNLQYKSKTEIITQLAQACAGFDHQKITDFLRFIEDRKNMFDPEIYEAVRRVFLWDSSTAN